RAGSALITCIGVVDASSWKWSLSPAAPEWKILDRTSAPAAAPTVTERVDVDAFTKTLDRDMDQWVWARLKHLVAGVLDGDIDYTHVEIHETIRNEMRLVWSRWV